MIYMEPVLQRKLTPIMSYALKPGGFLLLGASETMMDADNHFAVEDKAHKIYSKKPGGGPAHVVLSPKAARGQKPAVVQTQLGAAGGGGSPR